MHSLLSYGVSTVKDGIVFPSFHNRDLNIRRRRRQRKHIKNNLISKTTIFHVHHAFFVDFFAVTVRLRRENASFHVVQRKYTSDDEISSLFLHLDVVLRNSTLGWFVYV